MKLVTSLLLLCVCSVWCAPQIRSDPVEDAAIKEEHPKPGVVSGGPVVVAISGDKPKDPNEQRENSQDRPKRSPDDHRRRGHRSNEDDHHDADSLPHMHGHGDRDHGHGHDDHQLFKRSPEPYRSGGHNHDDGRDSHLGRTGHEHGRGHDHGHRRGHDRDYDSDRGHGRDRDRDYHGRRDHSDRSEYDRDDDRHGRRRNEWDRVRRDANEEEYRRRAEYESTRRRTHGDQQHVGDRVPDRESYPDRDRDRHPDRESYGGRGGDRGRGQVNTYNTGGHEHRRPDDYGRDRDRDYGTGQGHTHRRPEDQGRGGRRDDRGEWDGRHNHERNVRQVKDAAEELTDVERSPTQFAGGRVTEWKNTNQNNDTDKPSR